jgi:hypothetical protein
MKKEMKSEESLQGSGICWFATAHQSGFLPETAAGSAYSDTRCSALLGNGTGVSL